MALRPEHELHGRRRGRNTGLLVVLVLFVALIFALTIVKVKNGNMMEGFDHQFRNSLIPTDETGRAIPRPDTILDAAPGQGSDGIAGDTADSQAGGGP